MLTWKMQLKVPHISWFPGNAAKEQESVTWDAREAIRICRGRHFLSNKHYICFVDYHNKFPVIIQVEGFSADNLIIHVRLYFFRIQHAEQNRFRHSHKLCIQEDPRYLQVPQHTSCSVIIIKPSEQWPGRNMCKIHQTKQTNKKNQQNNENI